jgi:glucosamine kinase
MAEPLLLGVPLFLGVDGGGTRCRARLETADGKVLGTGLSGPASMRFGFATARHAILTAAREAVREAGLPDEAFDHIHAGIGLAGTGVRGARRALEAWDHPFASAWFEGDGYLAWLGAFGGGDGGIVICGTGSIGITFREHTIRIGGYGFPVSDEGSGADIGLNALRAALRTLDGRAASSDFSEEVLAKFSHDPAEIVDWMERASSTDYATLAPIVVRHAGQGDPTAATLMREAAAKIAELASALLQRGAPRVALVGGLAAIVRAYMPADMAAKLATPEGDAIAGGVLLAKRRLAERGPTPPPG